MLHNQSQRRSEHAPQLQTPVGRSQTVKRRLSGLVATFHEPETADRPLLRTSQSTANGANGSHGAGAAASAAAPMGGAEWQSPVRFHPASAVSFSARPARSSTHSAVSADDADYPQHPAFGNMETVSVRTVRTVQVMTDELALQVAKLFSAPVWWRKWEMAARVVQPAMRRFLERLKKARSWGRGRGLLGVRGVYRGCLAGRAPIQWRSTRRGRFGARLDARGKGHFPGVERVSGESLRWGIRVASGCNS